LKSNCADYLKDLENKAAETKINSTEKKYYILEDLYKTTITHQIIYNDLEIIKINSSSDSFKEKINEKLKNCFIIRYSKRGDLTVKNENGEKLIIKPGEILISSSEEKETVTFGNESADTEELIIIINIKYLQIFNDDQEIEEFINYFSVSRKNKKILGNIEDRLLNIFDLIIRYDTRWERKLYIFSKINELLGAVIRQLTKKMLKIDFYEESKIETIKSYLEKNYENPRILTDIHKKFYLGRNELSRQFKEETGVGMHDYLKNIKLEKAFYLLLNENKKISEVSLILGYQNYGYFSKIFFKYFGIYPNQVKSAEYNYKLKEIKKDYKSL
jgi:AraC-like DNA-binding protein